MGEPSARAPEFVLFDDSPILGGAELFALRLARHASAERVPVTVGCPGDSSLAERCAAAGIETRSVRYPSLGPAAAPLWPSATLRMRRLLAAMSPDAIAVGNTARAQAYLCAATSLLTKSRRPAVVQILHEQETLTRRTGRFALRRVGSLVPIGANVEAACRSALGGVPLWKANNFVDIPEPGPRREPPRDGRGPVLGVLARLIPEKGVLELVEELAGADGWERALVAGGPQDPAYAKRIRARIGSLGLDKRISLLGHVDDVPRFLSTVDAIVVPSTGNEAQPTAALEALAHGLPCIVRRPVYSPDFDGLPVLPYDGAAELARRLRELPAGRASLDEVRRRFGPEQLINAIRAAARGAERE